MRRVTIVSPDLRAGGRREYIGMYQERNQTYFDGRKVGHIQVDRPGSDDHARPRWSDLDTVHHGCCQITNSGGGAEPSVGGDAVYPNMTGPAQNILQTVSLSWEGRKRRQDLLYSRIAARRWKLAAH